MGSLPSTALNFASAMPGRTGHQARHLDWDENRIGMVNRERYQSHTVVQRGRAAPPRVAQYPPELQHMDSPQPREQPAGCPSPASHQGQSLGCWRIGDGNMLWVTALLQPEW